MKMIRAQLKANGLMEKCLVMQVNDVNDNEKWVQHVDVNVPEYDVVYSNNPLVRRLMKRAGKKVLAIPFFRRSLYDATKIRGRMHEGKEWEGRVPKKVLFVLKKMKAEERVKGLESPRAFQ